MTTQKMDMLEKGAIVQRDRKTYAVAPHIPGGIILDPDVLHKIADVAKKYQGSGAETNYGAAYCYRWDQRRGY